MLPADDRIDIPEIEAFKKTCMQCGARCDLLVLVCPSCSEVLPDGERPADDFRPYEFPSEVIPDNKELPPDKLPVKKPRFNEYFPETLPEGDFSRLGVSELAFLLIALTLIIWLFSVYQWH